MSPPATAAALATNSAATPARPGPELVAPRRARRRLRIVRARRDDMPKVAGFIRSSADWYREFVDPEDMAEHDVDEAWEARNFVRREFYLGRAEEGDVGTVSLQDFGDYLYVGYVYLDVDHVGKGYGRQLLDHAAEQAGARGKDGLVLIAHPEAKWAVKAYEKYGFERVATDRDEILAWNDGALDGYYEEGFHLYRYRV